VPATDGLMKALKYSCNLVDEGCFAPTTSHCSVSLSDFKCLRSLQKESDDQCLSVELNSHFIVFCSAVTLIEIYPSAL